MTARIKAAFSMKSIKKCKTGLKSGSAPGIDNITYDVIKLTGPLFDEQIHILFNRILQEKMWPRGFQISLLKSLFKKGRRDLMVNYRGITLSSTLGKWFAKNFIPE